MKETRVDPRVLRTRRLLMDAFITLNFKKDFKNITIKDITDEATVNRATLYSHFNDKYDLMDAVIRDSILENITKNLNHYDKLNQETIVRIFLVLTDFHTDVTKQLNLHTQCRRSYESFSTIIEQKIKVELEKLFYSLLLKQQSKLDSESLKIGAVILSSGIYGASVDWKNYVSLSAEQYIKKVLPFIVTELNDLK